MSARWRRITVLIGEYLLLTALIVAVVVIDNRFVYSGGSMLSVIAPLGIVACAYGLAAFQVPGRTGNICFFLSLPVFLYAWMLGFLFGGAGI
jgi:hypothetical protein